jgi:type IV pilus assembly protein PilN
MIKINLLPIKAARKREYVKQQLILGVVLLVGVGVTMYLLWSNMNDKLAAKQKLISDTTAQIEQYKKAIGKVEEFKGLEDTLNRKLKIIDDLLRGKTGPVRVLDRLSNIIPQQVWLTDWAEKGGTVTVEGESLSLKYVGQFMSVLGEAIEEEGVVKGAEAPAPAPAPPPTPPAEAKKAPPKAGAAVPEEVASGPGKPGAGRRFFSNIKLVETSMDRDSKTQQSYVKFKISMNVNYAI